MKDQDRTLIIILFCITWFIMALAAIVNQAHGETLPQDYQTARAIIAHKHIGGRQSFNLNYGSAKVNVLSVPGRFLGSPFALSQALAYLEPGEEPKGFGVVY